MPAIYSFSLDHKYDRDIINRLEGMKNRSGWIRQMLRQEFDHERLKILVELLYDEYKKQLEFRYTMPLDDIRKPRSLYEFRDMATRLVHAPTRIDRQDLPHVRQADRNSLQEQE